MIPLFLAAAASAACTASPAALLDANRHAVLADGPERGTATFDYAYSGDGLEGTATSLFDLASGAFRDSYVLGPTRGANGFDGKEAWMTDLSGASTPQDGGDRRALAVNEAYRNANLWWRADRGGARIEPDGCNALRVTPKGGKSFEAWFDPATHQLVHVREVQGFTTVDTRFADFRMQNGRSVPGTITVEADGDAGSRQTMRLTGFRIAPAKSASAFAIPTTMPADWSLPPAGRVTLPMRLLNNHVYVDVRVNGRGPFPFIIDTGGHDIVTPATLKALSLSAAGESRSGGAGEKTVSAGYTHVDSLDAGGAVLRNQTLIALDFSPIDVEGFQVGGMLGFEFLRRFVVQIDYGRDQVTVIDPARFGAAERRAAGVAIPFRFYDHMPQVAGRFDGRPALFDIDTGSRSDVTMTAPSVERLALRSAYPGGVTVTDGWGVGGPSRSYVVRAASLNLGPVAAAKPIAGLSAAKHGAFSDANYDGNVGSGLLKRFVVTFDYAHQLMYLKPLAKPDADTGRFDRTGMWLNLGKGGLAIMDVAADGPAAQAGLKIGDVVTAIGGKPVAGRALSDVRRDLKIAAVGRPLAVEYRRGGETGRATIVPRDLIPD